MGGHSLTASFLGNMLGGERDIELSQDSNTAGDYAETLAKYTVFGPGTYYRVGAIGPHQMGSETYSTVTLQYDGIGDEAGNTGFDKHLNNFGAGHSLFDGSEGGIRLWLRRGGTGRTLDTSVILRNSGTIIASAQMDLFGTSVLTEYDFAFSANDLASADSLSVVFRPLATGNIDNTVYLDHIDTMLPEPASVLPVLSGVGFLIAVQRRRRK